MTDHPLLPVLIAAAEGRFPPTDGAVRLGVTDQPGVLATIAGTFGDAGVSVKSVWQEGEGGEAMLLIITHRAPERRQRRVEALSRLDAVRTVAAAMRVESSEP